MTSSNRPNLLAAALRSRQEANAAQENSQPIAVKTESLVSEQGKNFLLSLRKQTGVGVESGSLPPSMDSTPPPSSRLNFADILARARAATIAASEEEPVAVADADAVEVPAAMDEDSIPEQEVAAEYISADRLQIADKSIQLDESQIRAVIGLTTNNYGCLIGAAGTGKTTTTRAVLDALINGVPEWDLKPIRLSRVDLNKYVGGVDDKEGGEAEEGDLESGEEIIPGIVMCAFTGQATQVIKKNMPAEWHRNVMTIHSMLGYAPVEDTDEDGKVTMRFEPSYTAENKMPWDIIVIDEASMVSTDLYHEIVAACKPTTRIYMIGDLNQLTPPIGQGILGFALSKWPVFELTHVHRQKDEAANKIVDAAWNILQGKWPEWDDFSVDPNWRVIGLELPHKPMDAHRMIVGLTKGLSQQRVSAKVDPETPVVYDPWRDRVLTNGNGYDENRDSSLLGQYPLNETLSQTFASPDKPRFVIDAGINKKRFAVDYRVMATKNEPPNAVNRVTNGLTGIITDIRPNPHWIGDVRLVGPEEVVIANQREMLLAMVGAGKKQDDSIDASAFADLNFEGLKFDEGPEKEGRNSGPASHEVTVRFDNGGVRIYSTKAQVDQLMIAYASTIHKAQGAEMPTVIIVLHHAMSRMLCREALYTAVTRASQRVVILYTDKGMRTALARQEIFGNDLETKVKQYARMMGAGDDGVTSIKTYSIQLTPEGAEDLFDAE